MKNKKIKKVLYFVNARMPTDRAHGVQIANICESLGLQSDTTLMIPKRSNVIKKNLYNYYSIKKSFITKVIKIPDFGHIGKIFFQLHTVFFLLIVRIFIFLKKYDVYITREVYAGIFKKDVIIEVHALPKDNVFLKYSLFRAKKILVKTSYLKKEIEKKYGINEGKVNVFPNGVNIKKFSIKQDNMDIKKSFEIPLDKTIIMYTGSFFDPSWKGVDVLLNASKLLDEKKHIVLVGGTQEEVMEINNTYKNVLAIERQSNEKIISLLQAADFLILPNSGKDLESKYYTSPLKLFEYMAAKKNILASDLPSINDLVNKEEVTFFEPDNYESLANTINKSIFDKNKIEASYKKVQLYDWKKRSDIILSL